MNLLANSLPMLAQFDNIGGMGGSVFGIIHTILFIIALVSIWTGGGSAAHKILWTLLVVFLPCIGVLLYFLIGRNASV